MLMPTKDRQAIFEYLFNEGVMVAKKGEFHFFYFNHDIIVILS